METSDFLVLPYSKSLSPLLPFMHLPQGMGRGG